jgi:uncharacterized protein YdhG (YjbR/CyaY superfamily)
VFDQNFNESEKMRSEAVNVDEYLQEVPEHQRESLSQLRKLCLGILDGYEECMEYGLPSYKQVDGEVEVAFASQVNYISLYILKGDVLDKYRAALAGLNLGKGCIRYRNTQQIDFNIVEQLLIETHQSDSEIC